MSNKTWQTPVVHDHDDEPDEPVDKYGNPLSGDRLVYCCFPDCGCDGARLCMAPSGASDRACRQNVEAMWTGKTCEQRKAVFALVGSLREQEK